jgi:hypothetical protein
VRLVPLVALPPSPEIILDNNQPGTSSLGNWQASGAPNPYGAGSLYAKAGGLWYRFEVPLPQAGSYTLSLWWTQYPSRSTAAPIEITHAAGTARTTVNQQQNGGQWNPIGVYTFGSTATITIRSLKGVSICADAVRLVPLAP